MSTKAKISNHLKTVEATPLAARWWWMARGGWYVVATVALLILILALHVGGASPEPCQRFYLRLV